MLLRKFEKFLSHCFRYICIVNFDNGKKHPQNPGIGLIPLPPFFAMPGYWGHFKFVSNIWWYFGSDIKKPESAIWEWKYNSRKHLEAMPSPLLTLRRCSSDLNSLIYSERRDCLSIFFFVCKVCLHSWKISFESLKTHFISPQIAILSDWIFKKLSSISLHPFPSVSGLKRYLFHTISHRSYII